METRQNIDRPRIHRVFSRRLLLRGAAATAALTALVACSSAPSVSPTAATAPSPTPAPSGAAPSTAPAPASTGTVTSAAGTEAAMNPGAAKGVELHLLAWNSYKSDGMKTWVPKFEQEVGGKIVFDLVESNSLADKQIVSLSGRTGEYDLTT